MLSSFTYSQVASNLYEFLASVQPKSRYLEECRLTKQLLVSIEFTAFSMAIPNCIYIHGAQNCKKNVDNLGVNKKHAWMRK